MYTGGKGDGALAIVKGLPKIFRKEGPGEDVYTYENRPFHSKNGKKNCHSYMANLGENGRSGRFYGGGSWQKENVNKALRLHRDWTFPFLPGSKREDSLFFRISSTEKKRIPAA